MTLSPGPRAPGPLGFTVYTAHRLSDIAPHLRPRSADSGRRTGTPSPATVAPRGRARGPRSQAASAQRQRAAGRSDCSRNIQDNIETIRMVAAWSITSGSNLVSKSPKSGILVTEVITFDKIAPSWVILPGRS